MKNRLLAFAVGTALVLAACGQIPGGTADASADQNPTTTAPTTAPTVAPTTTTAGDVAATTLPPTTTTIPTVTTITPSADAVEVMVYVFDPHDSADASYDCSAVTPVKRMVDSPEVLTGAFESLLAGLTAEELSQGYGSWFSAETGWGVDSVTVADGIARINFTEDSPLIPNASTSCGHLSFMAQLDSTATQFPSVDRVVYSFGGDVDAFYHWMQADSPNF